MLKVNRNLFLVSLILIILLGSCSIFRKGSKCGGCPKFSKVEVELKKV